MLGEWLFTLFGKKKAFQAEGEGKYEEALEAGGALVLVKQQQRN